MFSGIIEGIGIVSQVTQAGSNKSFEMRTGFSAELKPDQSVSHNGVCLTVESLTPGGYWVTAIQETLQKTNLGNWNKGTQVNLERCLQMNDRLDGHIVQGHIDTCATCISRETKNGSWEFVFEIEPSFAPLIIEKGSIALNGVSLTLFNVQTQHFTVAVIPYTFGHTTFSALEVNNTVNVEFDIVGKYIARMLHVRQTGLQ